jgi:hypothetical protein
MLSSADLFNARTVSHINTVNFFGGLIGLSFPNQETQVR